ncbi:hypothetical protein NDU88_007207 [Pleurodeles waltl]|uniref:Uncharacterized protein n=1 Tax=Pleurodeles waltl TaxID=8319 RepID=A0AAV7PL60_PLEWA|nr:hypothetical protein NDU88_007207 [Pleurodeles waltl]
MATIQLPGLCGRPGCQWTEISACRSGGAAAGPAAESGAAAPGLRWATATVGVPGLGLPLLAEGCASRSAAAVGDQSPEVGENGSAVEVNCGRRPYIPIEPRMFTWEAAGWTAPDLLRSRSGAPV